MLPVFPGFRERLLAGAVPAARDAFAWTADNLLQGRYAALGVEWPVRSKDVLFPPAIWRLDPVTKNYWPGSDRYCFDIAYRHERNLGDIKYVWEFNRLQFLQPIAAHYALTGAPAALTAIETAIASWFDANPPFRGVGWNSGIELALRGISLLTVTSLCGGALSVATQQRLCSMLNAHAYWMMRFPSRFSSANNHLVAEAASEFLIGTCMHDGLDALKWEARGRRVLEAEIKKQILEDGVPAEQSQLTVRSLRNSRFCVPSLPQMQVAHFRKA